MCLCTILASIEPRTAVRVALFIAVLVLGVTAYFIAAPRRNSSE